MTRKLTLCFAILMLTSLAAGGSRPSSLPAQQLSLAHHTLIFDSDRSGNYELYSVHDNGKVVSRLTHDSRFDSWWGRISPDRRTLLFYRTPKGIHDRDFTQTSLWTIDLAAGATRQLRAVGTDGWSLQGHAEWSPDGRHLIMFGGKHSNPQIYVTNADGTLPRAVTTRGGSNLDPSWSPDGRSVVLRALHDRHRGDVSPTSPYERPHS